jgi:hypothetical protein
MRRRNSPRSSPKSSITLKNHQCTTAQKECGIIDKEEFLCTAHHQKHISRCRALTANEADARNASTFTSGYAHKTASARDLSAKYIIVRH